MNIQRRRVVFMCAGQGSQYYGMGRELFESEPTFRAWLTRGDALFERAIGRSLLDVIYDPSRRKSDTFDRILDTHPAIYLIQYALGQTLRARGIEPDLFLGYSLGELTVAALAGAAPFEDLFGAAVRQAQLVAAHCPEAGMLAILDEEWLFHSEPHLFAGCELACVNFARHFVVAGQGDALSRIARDLERRGVICARLPIGYGFHSRWVDPAVQLAPALLPRPPVPTRLPVLSSTRAAPVRLFDDDHLWHVVRAPVRFADTLRSLESPERYVFVDLSPSGTLAVFVKNVLAGASDVCTIATMDPSGRDRDKLARAVDFVSRVRGDAGPTSEVPWI